MFGTSKSIVRECKRKENSTVVLKELSFIPMVVKAFYLLEMDIKNTRGERGNFNIFCDIFRFKDITKEHSSQDIKPKTTRCAIDIISV